MDSESPKSVLMEFFMFFGVVKVNLIGSLVIMDLFRLSDSILWITS